MSAYTIISISMQALGLIMNIVVLYYLRIKGAKVLKALSTRMATMNLCWAGVAYSLASLCLRLWGEYTTPDQAAIYGFLHRAVFMFGFYIQFFSILAITIERLIAIQFVFYHYVYSKERNKVLIVIGLCWLLAIVMSVFETLHKEIFRPYLLAVVMLASYSLFIITQVIMILAIVKSSKMMSKMKPTNEDDEKSPKEQGVINQEVQTRAKKVRDLRLRRVSLYSVVVLLSFFVCQTPQLLFRTLRFSHRTYPNFFYTSVVMVSFSGVFNPIIYFLFLMKRQATRVNNPTVTMTVGEDAR